MLASEAQLQCPVPEGGLLTFIIPTTGRETLHRTLTSLTRQRHPDWRAAVLLDGNEAVMDKASAAIAQAEKGRIWVMRLGHKLGGNILGFQGHGHSGRVRNFAFAHVRTPWIGFVDDDDTVGPNYVSRRGRVRLHQLSHALGTVVTRP